MGFALPSHGNLPLERYIGSCLISPCPRPAVPHQFSPSFPLQPRKFQKQFFASKTAIQNLNGSVLRINDQSVQKHAAGKLNSLNFQVERTRIRDGSYNGSPNTNRTQPNVFQEPRLTSALVDETVWTIGLPVLTLQSSTYLTGKPKNNRFKKNRKFDYSAPHLVANDSELRMLHNRSQFSKLAVHTQGVPLIQSSRYEQNCRPRNSNKVQSSSKSCNRVYWSSSSSTQSTENSSNKSPNKIALPQNIKKELSSPTTKVSECSGVNSDENLSCNSLENSLPRIIKPRKRRKKDRKPNIGISVSAEQRNHDDNNNSTKEDVSCVKERSCNNETSRGNEISRIEHGSRDVVQVGEQDNQSSSLVSKAVNFLLSDDHAASEIASENFEEIISHEEKGSTENISVSCQCRYCDPSSVIWNVNTRGYSPSLVSCILPFHDIHPDPYASFPNQSSGPISANPSLSRVSSSVKTDSYAKFQLFNEAPPVSPSNVHDSKLSALQALPTFKNSQRGSCRFPPPNFRRPPNAEPSHYLFPPRNSPQFHSVPNYSNSVCSINMNNIPDANFTERNLAENKSAIGSDRVGRVNCFSDSKNKLVPCPESLVGRSLRKPGDRFTQRTDFTQRFGFLNVSNFHSVSTANFIDTSRPPPPIPTKTEEPPPRIPEQLPASPNQRKSMWENQSINGSTPIFPERTLETSLTFLNSPPKFVTHQSPPEQKSANPWPVSVTVPNESTNRSAGSADRFPVRENICTDSGSPRRSSQNLEISSEIVTSLNGHRDIEIKFFMASSNTSSPATQSGAKFPSFGSIPEFNETLKTKT